MSSLPPPLHHFEPGQTQGNDNADYEVSMTTLIYVIHVSMTTLIYVMYASMKRSQIFYEKLDKSLLLKRKNENALM